MDRPPQFTDPQDTAAPAELLSVRQLFFNRVLYPFLILGLVSALMGALQAFRQGQWGFALLYATGFLVFAIAGLVRRLAMQTRSLALLGALMLVSVSALLRVGLSGVGPLLLILACATSSFLLGRKAAFMAVIFSIAAMATVGILMAAGIWLVPAEVLLTSLSLPQWVIALVVFTLVAVGLLTIPRMFEQRLMQSLVQAKERAEALGQANLALNREIAARRRAQKEVDRLATIIDATSDLVCTAWPDRRLFFLNPAGRRMLGLAPEDDLASLRIADLHPAWAFDKIDGEAIPAAIREGIWRGETAVWGPNGDEVPISQVIMAHTTADGRLEFLSTIMRDISRRKNAEAQLRQAQKMEAIGTLAGGIAHDFNNLLMGIQGRTSLLIMDAADAPRLMEHLKAIEAHVASAANLTRQLLGFARGGKFDIQPTDLNALVQESSRLFGRTHKEITILLDPAPDLRSVEVDRGQMEQVLLNLFLNAWQAMPSGGRIQLATADIDLDPSAAEALQLQPGRFVRLTVGDNGIGMDEATRQRIFEPFFTTRQMGRGSGLGLATVYGIVTSHGGAVTVQSQIGQGTCFTIFLPASNRPAIPKSGLSEAIRSGTETVLLVDDEEMVIDVASQMLASLGYHVRTAPGGQEALHIMAEEKAAIDLVILDLVMPGMSGAEVFDRIKALSPETRILISSGYSINGQASDILRRGGDGFIQKPFRIQDLSVKVRQVLDASRRH